MKKSVGKIAMIPMYLTVFLVISCGTGLPGDDFSDPLHVIKGSISNHGNIQIDDDLYIAIVWRKFNETSPIDYFQVSQEQEVATEFPVQFTIDLDRLPPHEVMNDRKQTICTKYEDDEEDRCIGEWQEIEYSYALGTIIVYGDENGNKKLDLVSGETSELVDTVLGIPELVMIAYVEGTPPQIGASDGSLLSAGFNLIKLHDERIGELTWPKEGVLPSDIAIDIELTEDPKLAGYLCADFTYEDREDIVSHLDPEHIQCSPDGRAYVWEYCSSNSYEVLCSSGNDGGCINGGHGLSEGEEVPQDWPCDIDDSVVGKVLETSQSTCVGDAYDPESKELEGATLTVTGESRIQIDYQYAHFRCEQEVHMKYIRKDDEITISAEPVDMDPDSVAMCDCLYNLQAYTPALDAGTYKVELVRRWDNISSAYTERILLQDVVIE